MTQTGPQRAAGRLVRGVMLFAGLITVPGGLYGVIAQHAVAAGFVAVLGLAMLGAWWLMRPRYASARTRRLGAQCSLLTLAIGAAALAGLVLFLASPAYGVSVATLMPALIAWTAALAALVARVLTGRRLNRLAAADAAAAPAPSALELSAARYRQEHDQRERERAEREISELQRQWQRGEPPRSPGLAVQPDGTVVLRPARARLRNRLRGSAGALPVALILILRTISLGWVGVIAVAAGVAAVLLMVLALHEIRLRRGAACLTATEVIVRAWYGRRRAVSRGLVQQAVLVPAELGSMGSSVVPLLLMIGAAGRCVLRLSGAGIPAPDLKGFAAALHVPVAVRARAMGPEALRRDYPDSVSWFWQHQVLVSVLAVVLFVAVVVAVLVALAVTGVIKPSPG